MLHSLFFTVAVSTIIGMVVGYLVCFKPTDYDISQYESEWDDDFDKEWQEFRKSLED